MSRRKQRLRWFNDEAEWCMPPTEVQRNMLRCLMDYKGDVACLYQARAP